MRWILISIKPQWCELIASGKKTVELRKNKPNEKTPFKVYIYCTQNTPYNPVMPWRYEKKGGNIYTGGKSYAEFLTARVIGEFVCDRIEEIGFSPYNHGEYICQDQSFIEQSCVSFDQMFDYLGEEYGYGWHISDLIIYDKPKALSEFKIFCKNYYEGNCEDCKYFIDGRGYEFDESDCGCNGLKPLERPPQSWCYVEENK